MWNRMVILLSLVINLLMLATWNARWSMGDPYVGNSTALPPAVKE